MNFSEAIRVSRTALSPLLAFNIVDPASAVAVTEAAQRASRPVLLQVSPRTVQLYGARLLRALVAEMRRSVRVPCFLHLDHCADEELLDAVITAGFDGLMADGSARPLDDNIEFTSRWVQRAHAAGLVVEGQLEQVRGVEEDLVVHSAGVEQDVKQCLAFERHTRVDLLGVDIGTMHGLYREHPRIRYDRLSALTGSLQAGFVIHGGSGLDAFTLRRLARHGVAKINFSTDLKLAWGHAVGQALGQQEVPEPITVLRAAHNAILQMAADKYAAVRDTER